MTENGWDCPPFCNAWTSNCYRITLHHHLPDWENLHLLSMPLLQPHLHSSSCTRFYSAAIKSPFSICHQFTSIMTFPVSKFQYTSPSTRARRGNPWRNRMGGTWRWGLFVIDSQWWSIVSTLALLALPCWMLWSFVNPASLWTHIPCSPFEPTDFSFILLLPAPKLVNHGV